MNKLAFTSISTILLLAHAPCHAWIFQTRFVERLADNTDVPLADTVEFLPGSTHRIRFQAGVFDDANGPAPAGGYNGHTGGTVDTFGGGTWTRTPGRLSPFIFFNGPSGNGNPPLPDGDPFSNLTTIDNAYVQHNVLWVCNGDEPDPMPPPVVRGLNTFISTYEVTLTISQDQASDIRLVFGGNITAVDRWNVLPSTIPPDCENNIPGVVAYIAQLSNNRPDFSRELLIMPAPATATLALAGALGALSRRRR
jgi:hypothetical protein